MAQRTVIDANFTLGLFLRLPYSENADRRMEAFYAEETKLVVPTLWEYECVTGLRRAVSLKWITHQDAEQIIEDLNALEFQRVAPTPALHRSALQWAERINQTKIYDAAYLALAESLSAEFWTADRRLAHTLNELGIRWIHAI